MRHYRVLRKLQESDGRPVVSHPLRQARSKILAQRISRDAND
jgi:hypothetical protein